MFLDVPIALHSLTRCPIEVSTRLWEVRVLLSGPREKENLLADKFTMSQLQLTRRNQPCGLQFCLRGPRNVRLATIWVADQNVVYLYGARGARYAKLRLTNGLALQEQTRAA